MTQGSIRLGDRGVVGVSGVDAPEFLQGLLTNDVLALANGRARYAALLSPQGKILFDFLLVRARSGFYLDCAADQAQALAKRLGFYRLRAKVVIEDLSATHGIASGLPLPLPPGGYADPRHADLGWRMIALLADLPEAGDMAPYEARRIALGVPKGGVDFAFGDTFPHEANLDRLHGVDFKKGCYVGQEVVSRVEHRGLARKRIVRLLYDGEAPALGAAVTAGDVALGMMGSSAAGHGLAMLRLDRLAEAAGVSVVAGGVDVRVIEEWQEMLGVQK